MILTRIVVVVVPVQVVVLVRRVPRQTLTVLRPQILRLRPLMMQMTIKQNQSKFD